MYYVFNRYLAPKTIFIWISELALLFTTALFLTAVRFSFETTRVVTYDPQFIKTIVLAGAYATFFAYFGLYLPELYKPGRQMFIKLVQATAVATILLFCMYYIFPSFKVWRGILFANMLVLPGALILWRSALSMFVNMNLPSNKVLIIGSGELAKKIGADIYTSQVYGFDLVGFIDDNPAMLGTSIVNPGVIGGYGDIARISDNNRIDRIIIALADRRAKLPMSALLECKLRGIAIEEGETFHERATGKIPLDHLKPSWMVFSDGFKSLRSRKILKRVIDLMLSVTVFALTIPLMLIAAAAIKLESRGPLIFRQQRVGENGRLFNVYKFRSMREDAESKTGPIWADSADTRVTKVGNIIRKLRIDELPQLVNVIKGDMSFVGPRPERPYFVDKLKEVIPYYEMRTVVKPGITGWAQIKYPYGASVKDSLEKLQYDIYYIKNMSPLLDAIIVLMTVKVVLTGRGAR